MQLVHLLTRNKISSHIQRNAEVGLLTDAPILENIFKEVTPFDQLQNETWQKIEVRRVEVASRLNRTDAVIVEERFLELADVRMRKLLQDADFPSKRGSLRGVS